MFTYSHQTFSAIFREYTYAQYWLQMSIVTLYASKYINSVEELYPKSLNKFCFLFLPFHIVFLGSMQEHSSLCAATTPRYWDSSRQTSYQRQDKIWMFTKDSYQRQDKIQIQRQEIIYYYKNTAPLLWRVLMLTCVRNME